jgi:hypothetical protein
VPTDTTQTSVTVDEVRAWGEIQAPDSVIVAVIHAVDALLAGTHEVPTPMPPDAEVAVLMQCSRILRRRKTPEGVAVFGSDVAIRISRFDPDINALLCNYEPARLGVG